MYPIPSAIMFRLFCLLTHSILIVQCLHKNETAVMLKTKIYCPLPAIPSGSEPPFTYFLYHTDILVDKSLFIKDFIEDEGKVFLITCPHQWGKTINIRMLKAFFEIEPDKDGNPLPLASTSNYRLFLHGDGQFDEEQKFTFTTPFLIAQHKRIIDRHMAQHPVIFFETLSSRQDKNFQSAVNGLARCIFVPYSQNRYVNKTIYKVIDESKNETERTLAYKYAKILDDFKYRFEDLDPDVIQKSVVSLSEILHKYLKRKVIILMDHYYLAWEGIFLNKAFSTSDKKKLIDFYTGFIEETFFKNPYLEKAIITGTLRPFQELNQAVFHKTIKCNPINGKFMQYFGFNQFEMEQLLVHFKFNKVQEKQLKDICNGYKINNRNISIYMPETVAEMSYLRNVSHSWVDLMGKNKLILNCIKVHPFEKKLRHLLNGSEIVVKVEREYFSWNEYNILIKALNELLFMDSHLVDRIFLFLHDLGFLAISQDFDINSDVMYLHLKIPNEQIHVNMKMLLGNYDWTPEYTTPTTTPVITPSPTWPDVSI